VHRAGLPDCATAPRPEGSSLPAKQAAELAQAQAMADDLSPGGRHPAARGYARCGVLGHAHLCRPMSFALLFSGQGTQHAAMMPWLAEDERVAGMRARLGVNDWRRSLEDPSWAANNANAQTLLTGLALAAWAQLAPMVPPPEAVAGYSVGELAAFSTAGAVRQRHRDSAGASCAPWPWTQVRRSVPGGCSPSTVWRNPRWIGCAPTPARRWRSATGSRASSWRPDGRVGAGATDRQARAGNALA
jgi:hypothetical protein